MSIHTFGDSHSNNGWNFDNINIHHIGSTLCYSFGRDKLNRLNIKNFGVRENDIVIFCFGEIDCRCHIYKYVNAHRNYQQIIDEIVNNYFIAIKDNITQYSNLQVFCIM